MALENFIRRLSGRAQQEDKGEKVNEAVSIMSSTPSFKEVVSVIPVSSWPQVNGLIAEAILKKMFS